MDSSFLLGVLCWKTGIEIVGEGHCTCSKAPWIWRLRVSVIVGWVVPVKTWDGVGVVLIALGGEQHKSTSIMVGSQAASPTVATSQSGSSSKSNTIALKPCIQSPWADHPLPCTVVTSMLVTGGRKPQGFLWGVTFHQDAKMSLAG